MTAPTSVGCRHSQIFGACCRILQHAHYLFILCFLLLPVADQGDDGGDHSQQLRKQGSGADDNIVGAEDGGVAQHQVACLLLVPLEGCQHIEDAGDDGQQVQRPVEPHKAQAYIKDQENDIFNHGDRLILLHMPIRDEHLHQGDHIHDHGGGVGQQIALAQTQKQQIQNEEEVAAGVDQQHLPFLLEKGHDEAADSGHDAQGLGDVIDHRGRLPSLFE